MRPIHDWYRPTYLEDLPLPGQSDRSAEIEEPSGHHLNISNTSKPGGSCPIVASMVDLKTVALAAAGTAGTALLIWPLAVWFEVEVSFFVQNMQQLLVTGEQADRF